MPGTRRRVAIGAGVIAMVAAALTSAAVGPVSPAAAAAASKPDCGAKAIYKTGGRAWRCTFADDFAGKALDRSKWTVQETATSGYQNGGDCFFDDPRNVSVASGALTLTTRREAASFTCQDPAGEYSSSYTSGMVSTWGQFAQAYGRFEIRAKFPATKVAGVHGALWLWPVDSSKYGDWPASGEIDIAEAYSQFPDRVIPYVHYLSEPGDKTVTNNYCMVSDPSAFHTYAAEWTPTRIKITYDGKTCLDHAIDPAGAMKAPAPFDQPYIVVLTQTLGLGDNARTRSTPLPAKTVVDYVRVWS